MGYHYLSCRTWSSQGSASTTPTTDHTTANASPKKKKRSINSLALSVYFKHPDFGMKEYEILSRASAFLLAVDPPAPKINQNDPYGHLSENERQRQLKLHQQNSRYTPAGHPGDQRELTQLGWLEYAPREVRPIVHCVCSSHVLAPFLWTDYYPQPWLSKVRQEHWYVKSPERGFRIYHCLCFIC
jgi:hypothetical protein